MFRSIKEQNISTAHFNSSIVRLQKARTCRRSFTRISHTIKLTINFSYMINFFDRFYLYQALSKVILLPENLVVWELKLMLLRLVSAPLTEENIWHLHKPPDISQEQSWKTASSFPASSQMLKLQKRVIALWIMYGWEQNQGSFWSFIYQIWANNTFYSYWLRLKSLSSCGTSDNAAIGPSTNPET